MGGVTKEIDQYLINYISYDDGKKIIPYILCCKDQKDVGKISFGELGGANKNKVVDEYLEVHYPMNSFKDIVDILRNEKPLYLTVLPDRNLGALTTTDEPIGEEEIS